MNIENDFHPIVSFDINFNRNHQKNKNTNDNNHMDCDHDIDSISRDIKKLNLLTYETDMTLQSKFTHKIYHPVGTVISKKFHPIYLGDKYPYYHDRGCDYSTNQVFPKYIRLNKKKDNLDMVAEIQTRREIFVQSIVSMLLPLKNFGGVLKGGIVSTKNIQATISGLNLGFLKINVLRPLQQKTSKFIKFYLESCFNSLYGKDVNMIPVTSGKELFLDRIQLKSKLSRKNFIRLSNVGLRSTKLRINYLLNLNGLHLKTQKIKIKYKNSNNNQFSPIKLISFKLVRIDENLLKIDGRLHFIPW
jgi:hypothetical protein